MALLEKNRVIDKLRLVRGKNQGSRRGEGKWEREAVLVGGFHVLSSRVEKLGEDSEFTQVWVSP